jgi:hypothetical protein
MTALTKSQRRAYLFGIIMLVVGVGIIFMTNSYWIDGEWKLTFSRPPTPELSEVVHRQYGPSVAMLRTFAGFLILGGALTLYKKSWTRYIVSAAVVLFVGMMLLGSNYG